VLQVRRGFERAVGTGIVIKGDGCGIMRVIENFQVSTPDILRVAEEKTVALGLKKRLPDFVVSLGNGRLKQVAEC